MTIYDYAVKNTLGEEISLADYRGKVLVIVNTATGCGFTPQYEDLEKLYEDYHDKGLEIIDIPCNQFAGQTPGTDEEIHEFCTLHYNTQFPQMTKSEVNGENALPLYGYLKEQTGAPAAAPASRPSLCRPCSEASTKTTRPTRTSSGTSPSSSWTGTAMSSPALSRPTT